VNNLPPPPSLPTFPGPGEDASRILFQWQLRAHGWLQQARRAAQLNFEALERRTKQYGLLYLSGGSTAQSSLDTTPALLTGFDVAGPTAGATASVADSRITVAEPGIYRVDFAISFTSASVSTLFNFEVYVNGDATGYIASRDTDTGGVEAPAVLSALLDLDADDYVEVYVYSGSGSGLSVTPVNMQLRLAYQAPS
jgi:hypothetical protein